jgi:solute:Na+ symporter, SSS family
VMYAQAIQLAVILLGVGGLAWVALVAADGWLGLQMRLTVLAHVRSVPPEALTSIWPTGLATASNPTGIGYLPFLLGTGVILSIAYWGMDYAVVQRTLAAGAGARRAITIAVLMRVILPVVIVAAGTVAVTLGAGSGYALGGVSQGYVPPRMTAGGLPMVDAMGRTILDFEMGIPVLMKNILPPGFFGLGIAALVAAAMSTLSAALTVVSSAVTRDIRFSFASGWSEGAVAVAGAAVVTAVALGLRPADQMAETAAMAIPFIHAPVLGATASLIVRRAGSGWVSALAIVCGLAAALLHHSLSHAPGAGAGFGAPFGGVAWMYPTPIARGIWTAMTGASASFAVALAGSFLIKSGNRK